MVEIIYYEVANKNKTIGYIDVRVPITKPTVLTLRKVAHVQNGKQQWVSLPKLTRGKEDEQVEYLPYAEFETKSHTTSLLQTIQEKLKEYCEKNDIKIVEPMSFEEFPSKDEELPF